MKNLKNIDSRSLLSNQNLPKEKEKKNTATKEEKGAASNG